MGKQKYLEQIKSLFKKSPIVHAGSIARIVKSKKKIKQYHKQIIKNLIKRGKIERITKGYFTKYRDPSLAVFCFEPAYLGLQDALSYHNLWEQEAIPIIITTRKVRQGIRKILETNVLIRRISSKYFFGFDYVKYGDFYLPVSDIEKTFIDMVYFRQNLDKDLLKNFKKRINIQKLKTYTKKYPKKISNRIEKLIIQDLSS